MIVEELEKNLEHWLGIIRSSADAEALDRFRIDVLGKSGVFAQYFKALATLPKDEKKDVGEKLNKMKRILEDEWNGQKVKLDEYDLQERIKSETQDITLPVLNDYGSSHIISKSIRRISTFYKSRGFDVVSGPEIEDEFHNFDALNMPKHHPARQSHDTFFIKGFVSNLLRTHTSGVQVRALQESGLPVRMISIGKVYRSDAVDATHSPMFHQFECLVADKKPISIANLKSELVEFIKFFFETDKVMVRFRPSFFPFTEPSMEFDCRYEVKNGKLVISDRGSKWLELGGAGMVHPNVFRDAGITDSDVYGFAFAFGVDRITMLKHGLTDLRHLFSTDLRFLENYA